MKLIITNNEKEIAVVKDFTDLIDNQGLKAQIIAELELLKKELLQSYDDEKEMYHI